MSNIIKAVIAGVPVGDEEPVRVMGVINASPESFYKGSVVTEPERAASLAEEMVREGASFIDVGGMSTAPYLDTYVTPEEEAGRVVPIIKAIKENSSVKAPVSIDTTRAFVAEKAIEAGADIVNDVRGLKEDPRMAKVVAEYGVPVIVAANPLGQRIEGADPVKVVMTALEESITIAEDAGVDAAKIVIDPAIGFIRPKNPPWYVWDATVIANLDLLRAFGLPILVGISRKSFLKAITGREKPEERLAGSLAATAIAVWNGAHIVRAHDVRETADAVKVAKFIRDKSEAGWSFSFRPYR